MEEMKQTPTYGKTESRVSGNSKIDPSFKSKRYRDKLRTEIKGLEVLIPLDRSALHRKLDSQTVFRLCISFFRLKILFKALGVNEDEADIKEEEKADGNPAKAGGPETLFSAQNIFQILDGFLMVAATDGTILYTSDNVLQYLGFNQVDLMHRCMYGVIHPEDHYDLKFVLEHTLRNCTSQRTERNEKNRDDAFIDKDVTFICRMKCFNGTTAGYLKIHCSGRIAHIPDLTSKTNNNVSQVVLLFCQPFMLTGNDFTHDVKQNVFWSKHDMDLTIRELDKKTEEMVGYGPDDLNGQSFYSIIHPEDLATFATCHKTLMESTEIQTVYFRLQSKSGVWTWMHSRGKVISKNSKKFSIVFTHCPVREEDSTFLQQETNLRRRYAIQDLLYFIQYGNYSNHSPKTEHVCVNEDVQGLHKTGHMCTPYLGFTEDVSMSFYTPMVTCPSSWHAMSDRHSPVLPSTHVAHKITQREKQLQFQEFRRRQQYSKQYSSRSHFPECNSYSAVENSQMLMNNNSNSCSLNQAAKHIKLEPMAEEYYIPCYHPQQQYLEEVSHHARPFHSQQLPPPPPYPYSYQYQSRFGLPPSPPISPQRYPPKFENNVRQSHQFQTPNTFTNHCASVYQSNMNLSNGFQNNFQHFNNAPQAHYTDNVQMNNMYMPQANLRVSMHCDYGNNYDGHASSEGIITTCPNTVFPINYVQIGQIQDRQCAISKKPRRENYVKYDIEASIHMKIVENPSCRSSTNVKQEVDLPSIGSFLEYLNDG